MCDKEKKYFFPVFVFSPFCEDSRCVSATDQLMRTLRGSSFWMSIFKELPIWRTFSAGTRKCPQNLNIPQLSGVFSYECSRKRAAVSTHTHTNLSRFRVLTLFPAFMTKTLPPPLNAINHSIKSLKKKRKRENKKNERIPSDSSQLCFRCYYYFTSAVFVVQCVSVGYQEQDVVAW